MSSNVSSKRSGSKSVDSCQVQMADAEGVEFWQNIIDGRTYPPIVLAASIGKLQKFCARDSDIWLVNFPKAGTNWLYEMVTMLQQESTDYAAKPKMAYMLEGDMCIIDEIAAQKPKSPRFVNTHVFPDLLHPSLFSSRAKILLIYRNPKDTLVSYYHHFSTLPEYCYKGSFNGFVEHFIAGNTIDYGSQFEHLRQWMSLVQRYPNKFLVIAYEKLKLDTLSVLRDTAHFLDLADSESLLADIVSRCGVSQLRTVRREQALRDRHNAVLGEAFFRKGVIGDWKNYFTVSQSERFDRIIEEEMRDVALPEPFVYE